ncbi:MAG: cadherin-like beta sandwich domain-containing protein [Candidatus Levyibacteriota bacterium]|nr:MAG: cadherin-like beta sandwich domain-containing protein [Candidatus Levybacteria bacterium]
MTQSRLSRRVERQTKQSILLSIIGIVAVLGFLAKFGIPLLANVSYFLLGAKDTQEVAKPKNVYVAPPVLDALPSATNSATIAISGSALENQTIQLFLNGEKEDEKKVDKKNTFSFADIQLKQGENFIQAKAIQNDPSSKQQESDFSNSYTIIFKKDAPALNLESPNDKQSFGKDDKTVTVKGKTDTGTQITVNDLWAIVDNEGKFSYDLPLQNGENKIKVIATDEAGNKTEKEITVTRSQ